MLPPFFRQQCSNWHPAASVRLKCNPPPTMRTVSDNRTKFQAVSTVMKLFQIQKPVCRVLYVLPAVSVLTAKSSVFQTVSNVKKLFRSNSSGCVAALTFLIFNAFLSSSARQHCHVPDTVPSYGVQTLFHFCLIGQLNCVA